MIPKIIHQIWVGEKERPEHIKKYMEGVKSIFSDHEYIFWNNDNLPELNEDCQKKFLQYKEKPAFQADLLRYVILNKYGGIYLDSDFECYKKFDHIFEKPFFCVNRNWHVTNAIFACESNNPILTNILKDVLKIKGYLGPLLLSQYILNFMGLPYKTNIFKSAKSHEYIQCETDLKFYRKENSYCFHDALESWLPKNTNN
jgi:mannosyltransferase OCH1-like enzyme